VREESGAWLGLKKAAVRASATAVSSVSLGGSWGRALPRPAAGALSPTRLRLLEVFRKTARILPVRSETAMDMGRLIERAARSMID